MAIPTSRPTGAPMHRTCRSIALCSRRETAGRSQASIFARRRFRWAARIVEWRPPAPSAPSSQDMSHADIAALIGKVNGYWQAHNPPTDRAFWDIAAYHTGNMEAYKVTGDPAYLDYSLRWAEHNRWM